MTRSIQRIIAALVGLVFLAAGCLKVRDPADLAITILNYRLIPWTGGVLLALYLPWLEILCGAALLFHVAYRGALWIAAFLFAMFLFAYGSTRPRGLDVECGCFGHGVHRGYWPVLIVDTLLLAAVIWLLKAGSRPPSPLLASSPAND
jgi:uncharacterized membrane protein YphA (DoxX/SURF4 family)